MTGEVSCKDEARIGQKNGQVRQWAKRGTRPRQPADQRYDNAYLFGAICPARGVGAALALPYADTEAMQLHLDEISRHVAKGAHAVLLLDRAGWHTTAKLDVPKNITPIFLPSRAARTEPRRKHLAVPARQLALQPRLRKLDAIIEAACEAWRKLIALPETITSIGMRDWAHVGRRHDPWYNLCCRIVHDSARLDITEMREHGCSVGAGFPSIKLYRMMVAYRLWLRRTLTLTLESRGGLRYRSQSLSPG